MFYLVEIAEGDKKVAGKAVYEFDTLHKAEAAFHKKLGIAMDSDLYTKEVVYVLDDMGNKIMSKAYNKEVYQWEDTN